MSKYTPSPLAAKPAAAAAPSQPVKAAQPEVKVSYGEWLTLRKHENFQPLMVTLKGSLITQLQVKGLINPKDLKITPLGEKVLAEYLPRQHEQAHHSTDPHSHDASGAS